MNTITLPEVDMSDVIKAIEEEHKAAKLSISVVKTTAVQTAKKMWFHTNYKEANTQISYTSGVYANGIEEARELAEKRNLNERVIGESSERPWDLPSVIFRNWFDRYFNNKEFDKPVSKWAPRMFDRKKAMEEPYFEKLNNDLIHGVVWIAYLAMKAGVLSVDEALSDRGIVHMATHLTTGVLDNNMHFADAETSDLARLLPEIEAKIPGLVK